ncbi:NAD(P)-binding protein [Pleurotus eryngii]|uniref:NAD(P)-binding protein n=1 Tax=Pleurotus eryngii TaxID=5323 RepID=A0A9P5ZID0_PLEER|nr:NAD(P)-binding protein [Pleurotus eryngii]
MKAIVLGATGVIGLPVSQALSRAGHIVYGVTRSESNAQKLAAEEIIPIVAEPTSDSWHRLIAQVDVVVESVGGYSDLAQTAPAILRGVSESASKLRPPGAPKLTYIYTSGIWIHGDNRKDVVSDTTPITKPIDLVTWRIPFEQAVIGDPNLNGFVVRPALVYGRTASILAGLFRSASEGKVAWYGTPGGRYCLVHADDLADLYVRAVEQAQVLGGQIFDAANDFTESVDDLMQRLTEISGAQSPYEYIPPSTLFETAIGTTVLCRPYLARALLGWTPRKPGLADGLEIYYAAWSASRQA